MPHHCSTLVLHCIDFRFGSAIKQYLEENGLLGDCDIVSLAGAVKNIVSPANGADRELVLRQIDISRRLHGISRVVLINHTDCGAYGGRAAFVDRPAENKKHAEDLAAAKNVILQKFPDLAVSLMLAQIEPDGAIRFEELY